MNARVELPPAREVCPTTTRRVLGEGALLVDVRELNEVGQLAIDVPGTLLLPMSELEARYAELPRDRTLVLACTTGDRSLKATYFLMYHGYTQVANLEGGIMKWAVKGFPIRGAAHVPAVATPAATGCCGGGAPAVADTAASACCGGAAAPAAAAKSCCSPSAAATPTTATNGCC